MAVLPQVGGELGRSDNWLLAGSWSMVTWSAGAMVDNKHHPLPAIFVKFCKYGEEIFADGVFV